MPSYNNIALRTFHLVSFVGKNHRTHTVICTRTNRFGLSYNERTLIGVVIIASIVFFAAPAILIGSLLHTSYGTVIVIPFPLILLFIGLYVLWRVRTYRKARKTFAEMTTAAQPVTGEFRPTAIGTISSTEILPAAPLNSLDIASPAQSENEDKETDKTAISEVHQDNERILIEEHHQGKDDLH